MVKRNYRTDEEWLALIQECRTSGLTDISRTRHLVRLIRNKDIKSNLQIT